MEYRPAYSPDGNPIEQGGSKLTTARRQRKARTRHALERGALATLLPTISSADAQAWFRHCGYLSTRTTLLTVVPNWSSLAAFHDIVNKWAKGRGR